MRWGLLSPRCSYSAERALRKSQHQTAVFLQAITGLLRSTRKGSRELSASSSSPGPLFFFAFGWGSLLGFIFVTSMNFFSPDSSLLRYPLPDSLFTYMCAENGALGRSCCSSFALVHFFFFLPLFTSFPLFFGLPLLCVYFVFIAATA